MGRVQSPAVLYILLFILPGAVLSLARRLIGATEVTGPHPWMVSLQSQKNTTYSHKCGGVLISAYRVLTAAHCLTGQLTQACIGGHSLFNQTEFECIEIANSTVHPKYNVRGYTNDIAILWLARPSAHAPLAINTLDRLDDANASATIYGWGIPNQAQDKLNLVLQSLNVTWLDLRACEKYPSPFPRPFPSWRLCMKPDRGSGPCVGDSGGPAVAIGKDGRPVLVGIASVGTARCGWDSPTLFVRVRIYLSWLNSTTCPEVEAMPGSSLVLAG